MSEVMAIDGEQVQFVINDAEDLSAQSLSDVSLCIYKLHFS